MLGGGIDWAEEFHLVALSQPGEELFDPRRRDAGRVPEPAVDWEVHVAYEVGLVSQLLVESEERTLRSDGFHSATWGGRGRRWNHSLRY